MPVQRKKSRTRAQQVRGQDITEISREGTQQSMLTPINRRCWLSSDTHVHPIFARSNFARVCDVEYARMLPALHLGSRILTSPRSLQFFHALRFGKTDETVPTPDGEVRGRFCRRFPGRLPPSEADKIRVALRELALCTRFDLGDTLIDAEAYTRCAEQIHAHHIGCRSVVCMRRNIPRTIAQAASQGVKFERRAHVAVARLLVHEVAHAFNNACYGRDAEMFFEDDQMCEAGLCMEKLVWGGQLVVDWDSVYVRALPSYQLWYHQKRRGAPFPIATNAHFGPSERMWQVSDHWVRQLFSDHFWGDDVERTNGRALRLNHQHH